MIKEVALADLGTMEKAIANGVNRVELNSRLDLGGLTPDDETVQAAIALAQAQQVDLVVMVRPRGGDFDYSAAEIEIMHQTLLRFKRMGVKMVTFGVVDTHKRLARDRMIKLLEAAKPMKVVYHMAFDDIAIACQAQALRWLAQYGVVRVLTHGGSLAQPIADTMAHLQETIAAAPTTLSILPGGGITFENADWVAKSLAVSEVHGSKIVPLSCD